MCGGIYRLENKELYMILPVPSHHLSHKGHIQDIVTAKAHQTKGVIILGKMEKVSIIDSMMWLHCIRKAYRGLYWQMLGRREWWGRGGLALMCSDTNLMVKAKIACKSTASQGSALSGYQDCWLRVFWVTQHGAECTVRSGAFIPPGFQSGSSPLDNEWTADRLSCQLAPAAFLTTDFKKNRSW